MLKHYIFSFVLVLSTVSSVSAMEDVIMNQMFKFGDIPNGGLMQCVGTFIAKEVQNTVTPPSPNTQSWINFLWSHAPSKESVAQGTLSLVGGMVADSARQQGAESINNTIDSMKNKNANSQSEIIKLHLALVCQTYELLFNIPVPEDTDVVSLSELRALATAENEVEIRQKLNLCTKFRARYNALNRLETPSFGDNHD